MLLKKWIAVLSLGLAATAAQAHSDAVLGGALGGAAGAVIGSSIGGRDGAIVGGALGAATGVAISQRPYYYEPAPVVYAPPRPVVVEEPVYVRPRPVIIERERYVDYGPGPYWAGRPEWRHHGWKHRGWERRGWDD
ncbi:YMGG-like glycine zipper-containing protein [Pseudogulbenkiania ferrooxidans]|uniref:17 kDa surface antigen n=1 Tax=Pseudogulbenkiania ferrooxidans 2002 TaxID=279714 RepID=B9Z2I8_9NEIS|nr:YMGG-like glycine zipper-containing protein [Pseudogulbenkiania ferrooxidans]EEG08791.1 17 kDa surface antigen [Pseudogulbenkiania ferrooxidans 2002]